MRKAVLIALSAAGVAAASPAALAQAYPLGAAQLAQRVYNGEFRGYTRTFRGFENQIWSFRPDGSVRAVADSRIERWPDRDEHLEWQDSGTWRVTGDQVCVSFVGPNHNLDGCYTIVAGPGKQVRLLGPYTWEGTLEPQG